MSRMLLTFRSFRMLCTDVYSLQSSGNPRTLLASTVSSPFSYRTIAVHCISVAKELGKQELYVRQYIFKL